VAAASSRYLPLASAPSTDRASSWLRGRDHTVPTTIAKAEYKKQSRNEGVTEFVEFPDRGHALTIDNGWHEVADAALAFVQRFARSQP
jgi:hypothetical protein